MREIKTNFPTELQNLPVFLLWRYECIDEKPRKVPYDLSLQRFHRRDFQNLGTLDQAVEKLSENTEFSGIGICIKKDSGLVGIDFDTKSDDLQRLPEQDKKLIKLLSENTYCERSPSGRGVHAFFFAEKKYKPCRQKGKSWEVYDNVFFTITGDFFSEKKEISHDQSIFDSFYNSVFAPNKTQSYKTQSKEIKGPEKVVEELAKPFSKEKIKSILNEMARDRETGYFFEETPEAVSFFSARYPGTSHMFDRSSVDMSLVSKIVLYTRNFQEIENLWALSWVSKREKFETRQDYRARTINAALHTCEYLKIREGKRFSVYKILFKGTETPEASETPLEVPREPETHLEAREVPREPETHLEAREVPREPETHLEVSEASEVSEVPETHTEGKNNFPLEVFPKEIRDWVIQISEFYDTPVDFAVAPLFSVLSAVTNTRLVGRIETIPNLFLCLVADSGDGKSAVSKQIFDKTIFHIESRLQRENEALEKAHILATRTYSRDLKRAQRQNADFEETEPETPKYRDILVNDSTVESLCEILSRNEKRILLWRDELSAWVKSLNLYKQGNKGVDKEFFMSVYSGQAIKVSRKGKKAVFTQSPRMSVFGGSVWKLDWLVNDNTGFLERILFFFSDEKREYKKFNTQNIIDAENEKIVSQKLITLYDSEPRDIELSKEALYWYKDFYEKNIDENLKSFDSKFRVAILRIALILHEVESVFRPEKMDKNTISKDTLEKADKVISYFRRNVERIIAETSKREISREADSIIEYCQKRGINKISIRQAVRGHVRGCSSAKETKLIFDELIQLDCAMWVNEKAKREITFVKD